MSTTPSIPAGEVTVKQLASFVHVAWTNTFSFEPKIQPVASEGFDGARVAPLEQAVGIYGGKPVLVHVQTSGEVAPAAGPFDSPEEAVAAYIAQAAHQRASQVLAALAFNS